MHNVKGLKLIGIIGSIVKTVIRRDNAFKFTNKSLKLAAISEFI